MGSRVTTLDSNGTAGIFQYFVGGSATFILLDCHSRVLSVAQTPAAINRQDSTRNEAGRIAAQEHRRLGTVVGLARSAGERLLGLQKRTNVRIVDRTARHR